MAIWSDYTDYTKPLDPMNKVSKAWGHTFCAVFFENRDVQRHNQPFRNSAHLPSYHEAHLDATYDTYVNFVLECHAMSISHGV